MAKVAIVYWSGTGNTEAMANSVLDGAKAAGADASLFSVSEFDASSVSEYDAIAFGCPSMGVEELEEGEFEPVFSECEAALSGKKIGLFGSYGWGDGAVLVCEPVICNDAPDDDAKSECEALGKALA